MDGAEQALDGAEVLVVNLNGTLLRSDLLHETFWNAFGRNWRSPFAAISALLRGRPALKRYLSDAADVDIPTLPWNEDVLDRIRRWRARGGRVVLATASDPGLARAVADHLGLFDDVVAEGRGGATDPEAIRAAVRALGADAFDYIGDGSADLPIWRAARRAITVNASPALRNAVDETGSAVEHMDTAERGLRPYLRAMRPHQWLKNVLVFLPMVAAHQWDAATVTASALIFVAFSLTASSVYVLNDLLDLAADRAHPRKRARPFASGAVPIAHGTWMAGGLLLAGAAIAAAIGPATLAVMVGYYVATTAYSLYLKRRTVVDICMLAGLYTLRILAGGVATGIGLSVWLLAFSIFLFFSLAAVKRQAELRDSAARGELGASGRGYEVDDLPLISQIAIASGYVSVLVMALYVNTPAVSELYSTPEAMWGICLVLLYWITRMVMVTHRDRMNDDPVVYAVKDPVSRACLVLVAGFALFGTMV